jgi:rod shape-determining protein MreC
VASRASRGIRTDGRFDGVLLGLALLISLTAIALPQARTDSLAGGLRRTVLSPLVSLQLQAERVRAALASRDSVTLATDSLTLRALDAERLRRDNDHLRELLGLGARVQQSYVPAEALHRPGLGEEHVLVLSAGSRAGVAPFSAVVAPQGIVGYVRSVDVTTSVAIVWPHPDFRVSAMADSGSATGIVSAYLGDGASRFLLQLRGVPFREPLRTGMRIVSSGIGGTFPRGVAIGTVLAPLPSDEGWARNYLLLPAVHPADVNTVLILTGGSAR